MDIPRCRIGRARPWPLDASRGRHFRRSSRRRPLAGQDLLAELWAAVEEAIALRDCEVYSYVPDLEADPFSEGVLWSFNYFFFNKSLKRIVYLSCVARSKYAVPNSQDEEADDDEYRIGDDDDELMVAGDFESGEE